MRLDPKDFHPWFAAAAGRLRLGDAGAYRAHARDMLARFGKSDDPSALERLAKTLVLATDRDEPDTLATAKDLIDRGLSRIGDQERFLGWFELTKALTDYRAGNFAESLRWAEQARGHVPKITFGDRRHPHGALLALTAMAQHAMGRAADARRTLDECQRLWDGYPKPGEADLADGSNRYVWEILLREARGLIINNATDTKS